MAIVLDRLKSQLLSSGLQQENFALFQVINQLIDVLRDEIATTQAALGSGSPVIPPPPIPLPLATFLTKNIEPGLPNSRQVIAGSGIQFNDSPGNRRVISSAIPFVIDGFDGEEGPIGPRGLTGDIGLIGPSGIPGLDGMDGDIGAKGIPGIQGPIGLTGLSIPGIDGIDGLDGEDGVGIVGPQGIQGIQGIAGVSNIPGIDGIDGEIGEEGIPGIQGIQGLQGVMGFSGLDGIDGETEILINVPDTSRFAMLDRSNIFTLINPIVTIAESWIGPSSTTGIYFKGGNIGFGTTEPNTLLHLNNASNVGPQITLSAPTGGTPGIIFRPWQTAAQWSNPAQASITATDANYSADIHFYTKTPGAITNALVERMTILNTGAVKMASLGAFAASDKYVVIDASGNLHISALGPAS